MKQLLFSTSCEAHEVLDDIEAFFEALPTMVKKPETFDDIWR